MSGSADDRFREMFYEEARELLIGLEEGLMDLERRQSDRAHLDKTFRAAHSLKGAAAMVGLGSIAEFTHGIEAVLERIRAGLLAVDSDIITTLLEARDHLAAMVESEAARSPIPPSGELTQRLVSLLRGPCSERSPSGEPTLRASHPPAAGAPPARRRRLPARRHRPPPTAAADARSGEPRPKGAKEAGSEGAEAKPSPGRRAARRENGPISRSADPLASATGDGAATTGRE